MFIALVFLAAVFSSYVHSAYAPDAPAASMPDDNLVAAVEYVPPVVAELKPFIEPTAPEKEQGGGSEVDATFSSQFLFDIMDNNREKFGKILDDLERYEVQILLSEITRDRAGQPSFINFEYEVDANKYFYPASIVKMAIAALTLQKINSLEGAARSCVLSVASSNYGAVGRWGHTIEQYIEWMMVISDNISYNMLYDFLGQEYINETLHSMGYLDVQIVRRFDSPTTAAADRANYACELRDNGGALVYSRPSLTNTNIYTLKGREGMTGLLRGSAYYTSGYRVATPKEFYDYNYMSIDVMQQILKAIIFPLSVEESARFTIQEEDRKFLLECMLGYDTENKYFIYGGAGQVYPHIEIYNKNGMAYGNLLDSAYIRDTLNNIEFMLTAAIYVNANGVLGDDAYEYEEIGKPFLKELGLAVYNHYLEKKYSGTRWQ
jgi:hypothetical protein